MRTLGAFRKVQRTQRVAVALGLCVSACSQSAAIGAVPRDAAASDALPDVADAASLPDAAAGDAASDAPGADADSSIDAGPSVASPCGHFAGKESWTCQPDGTTLKRSIGGATESFTCPNGCVKLPSGFDDQCRVRSGSLSDRVNGHALDNAEAGWVHYVAYCVVPVIQGARDARLTDASQVTWWSLKEGVLDVSNPDPVGFSLCQQGGKGVHIGPTTACATGQAWQVGASAIQVPCCSQSSVDSMAAKLYPGKTTDQVVAMAATEAGYLPGTSTGDAIVASTGYLRVSWLLRSSPVGFSFQAPIVASECITGQKSWCYGSGWSQTASFAPTKAGAMQSISDLHGILDLLSP
jgi:hypothetical protein